MFPVPVLALRYLQVPYFPERIIKSEFKIGQELELRGKGLDRCWLDAGKEIGKWNTGRKVTSADDVLWLSPAAVSRSLGWEVQRERMSSEEASAAWSKFAEVGHDHLIFFVRLCSFPQSDPLELGVRRGQELELNEKIAIHFKFTDYSNSREPHLVEQTLGSASEIDLQKYSSGEILERPLYWFSDYANLLPEKLPLDTSEDQIQLGDFYARYFMLLVPKSGFALTPAAFRIDVDRWNPNTERHKEQQASFQLFTNGLKAESESVPAVVQANSGNFKRW